MRNELEMNRDGINLYLALKVRCNKVGLFTLGTLIIIVVLSFLLIVVKDAKEFSTVQGIFILLGLIIFLWWPGKYFLWNMYGVEKLIINTNTISFSYDYGWFTTNLQTLEYIVLGTTVDQMKLDGKTYLGQLYFTNYDSKTKLPEIIHATTVLLEMDQISEIQV